MTIRYPSPALALAALVIACSAPPAEQPRDAGNDLADAGEELLPPPTWEGVRLERRWQREGFGEGNVLRAADLDGDGSDEIIVGGRGVAAVHRDARLRHQPMWSIDWNHTDAVDTGGENHWTYALGLTEATGDGVADALIVTSYRDGYLVDGATGAKVWHAPFDTEMLSARAAFLDLDGDGVLDVFPVGGVAAFSGKTGERLWKASGVPSFTVFAIPAELDGEPGAELLVTTELDEIIGTPETPPPGEPEEERAPTLFALSRDGTPRFEGAVPGNIISLAAADLTGDGIDEAIVGTSEGAVHAFGAAGELWRLELGPGLVRAVAAVDVDADGRAEVFAGYELWANDPEEHDISWLVGITNAGVEQWREIVGPQVTTIVSAQLDDDPAPELLVGAGDVGRLSIGYALAFEPGATQRQKWRVQVGEPVLSFTQATVDGRKVVVFSGADCLVRAVDPRTGQPVWNWFSGGFVFTTAAGDVDGDGLDEVASGDEHGHVALTDTSGHQRWARRANVGQVGMVNRVFVADVNGDAKAEVIAGGTRFYTAPGERGFLEVIDAAGFPSVSRVLEGAAEDVLAADLTGDGSVTILVGERSHDGCHVHATDPSGNTLWRTRVNTGCEMIRLSAGDTDGDGRLEIAYGDTTLFNPPRLALLEADGTERWNEAFGVDSFWVTVVPGGVLHGGATSGEDGHVSFRDAATKQTRWTVSLPAVPDPVYSGNVGASALFGTALPDLDGDGFREVVASSAAGELRLLDGRSGEVAWTVSLADLTRPSKERHGASTLAYVPHGRTGPAWIAAGQWSSHRLRSRVFALQTDGEIVSELPVEGTAHAMAVGRFRSGEYGAAVAAGLGVYALEASTVSAE